MTFVALAVGLLCVLSSSVISATAAGPAPWTAIVPVAPARAIVPAGVPVPNPYTTGLAASLVLGQGSFTTKTTGYSAAELSNAATALAFGPGGSLWVSDTGNNRVIEYLPPFANGAWASVVIGQPGFSTTTPGSGTAGLNVPTGLAFDGHDNLWVADSFNNRVLEFVPPFSDGMRASLVLGQSGFTTNASGTSASTLDTPEGPAFDAKGDLWVPDDFNNRVLEFVPPFSDGMNASLVLGQKSFTTAVAATNQSGLNAPRSVTVSPSGAVWVSDWGSDRALEFLAPFSDGMRASVVLGEVDFNSSSEVVPYGIYSAGQVAFDEHGDLWLAEGGYPERVQEYLPGFSVNQPIAVVLGESSLVAGSCGTTATTLCAPEGVAVDAAGHVWVADAGNARILEYIPYGYAWTFSETGLASGTSWSVTVDGTAYSGSSSTIVVPAPNGSHNFSINAVAGYAATPGSGSDVVNATPVTTSVTFTPTILGLDPGAFAFLVVDLALVVGGGAGLYLYRRRGRRRSSPPPLRPSPSATAPPPSGSPSAGPAGTGPPAWQEGTPGGAGGPPST